MNYSGLFHKTADNLIFMKNSIQKQISSLPEGTLRIYNRQKAERSYTDFLFIDSKGNKRYIKNNKDLLRELALKNYLEKELFYINELICATDLAGSIADRLDMKKIIEELPAELTDYLNLESLILSRDPSDKYISCDRNSPSAPMPDFYNNKRRHVTSDGVYVKSKSELIINEKLLQHGVTFKYEAPKTIGNKIYYPDFTILKPDNTVYYWEHAGMMTREEYRQRHKKKMEIYELADIVPWKNLIVTYDDENENIDIRIIESEIKNKLL